MNRRVTLAVCGILAAIVTAWIAYKYWPDSTPPIPAPIGKEKPKEKVKEKERVVLRPPVFEPAPVSLAAATEHYYQGKEARQIGVKENAIVARRAAVLKGRVLTRDGQPLVGVKIHVAHHPELGSTESQADGGFNLVVNGGGRLCVHYAKDGYLPSCRFVNVPWQDYAWLPDVALITLDAQVTSIDLKSNAPLQVARGTVVKDNDGERQATVFIPQGTKAQMILADKTLKALDSIKVRISEYTVGPNGPAAMPAALPPTSAYTYAFELSADEVVADGIKVAGKDLILSQSVFVFVENFLKFPVGTPMPVGYFDNDKAAWVAAQNGLVIQLLPAAGELAQIDLDGTGKAAPAAALKKLGISDAERKQLAALYKPGQSLWRLKVDHFSTHDANQAPGDAEGPDTPGCEDGGNKPCGPETTGSVIDIYNQVLGEDIRLVGVPFRLHYRSNRVAGHAAARAVRIPLSGAKIPKSLKRIDLEVQVAGQKHVKSFPPEPNQSYTFAWDGKDAQGRTLAGAQPATIRLGWVYDAVYQVPERFGEPPVRPTPTRSRQELTFWRDEGTSIGALDARGMGLGGWSLSIHHAYDPVGRVLYLGHGAVRGGAGWGRKSVNQSIDTVAGGGAKMTLGDGGPALQARIDDIRPDRGAGTPRDRYFRYPRGLVVGPDGSIYIADANDLVRKISPDGVIQTIAGGGKKSPRDGLKAAEVEFGYRALSSLALGADGSLYVVEAGESRIWRIGQDGILSHVAGAGYGFSGDGGPARKAKLAHPAAVAVATDGALYIADTGNHRIRRIGPDGIISSVAGTGKKGYSGDGSLALTANFYSPTGLVLAPDGTLFITDAGNYVVRRLTPGGGLSTVAGLTRKDWTHDFGGDGGPALKAKFDEPSGLALGPDGALYIADTDNHRIRRVGLDGIITTVAGAKVADPKSGAFSGDGGPAADAALSFPSSVTFGPDGSMYVYDGYLRSNVTKLQHRIRRIAPPLPGFSDQEIAIPSEDGQELYRFNATGRHLETLSALSGKSIHRFEYDKGGRLITVTDAFKNTTTIERDADGHPRAVIAPYRQRTALSLDAAGYLAKVTNPANESVELAYHPGGLLASMRSPRGFSTRFTYDDMGRLTKDEDAAGGFTALARNERPQGLEIALTTALKPATIHSVDQLATGSEERLEKCCCGAETKMTFAHVRGHEVRHPDGTIDAVTLQPDPRWGLQSPLLKQFTTTTPGGLQREATLQRKAKLARPTDPLSVQSIVDTLTVNGRTFTSTLDVAKKTRVHVSPAGRTTTAHFDDHDRIIRFETPGLAPVYFDYDDNGRLIVMRQGEGDQQRLLRLDHDTAGNVVRLTDGLKRNTNLEYDSAGRLTKQTLPDKRAIAYTFDSEGNLKALTPPGKPAHGFEYTSLNQTAKYLPPEAGAGPRDFAYEFNKDRKLTKIARPDGTAVTLAYSKVGLLESLKSTGLERFFTFDPKTEQLRNVTGTDGSISFDYDGWLPTETKWDGPIKGSVSRRFDKDFRMSSIRVNAGPATEFKYDADGLLTQAGALTFERDPQSGFIKGTTLGAVSTAHEYTGFGERKKFVAKVAGKDLMAVAYERDPVGRIVKKTETIDGKTDVYTYEYDSAGRLKNAAKNGKTVGQYEYDSNGNRTKYEGQRGRFAGSYDAQDRIQSYGPVTFKHNANGDLESRTEAGKSARFDYDALGNLRTAKLPNGDNVEYLVDAANRRVGKKVNGKVVQGFLYQNRLRPSAELDGQGKVVSRFIYGSRINVPEYLEKGGKTYRILTDHVGSPRLVVDAAVGKIVQRLDYDEFGNVLADSDPSFQPFGFAGGMYDATTGLARFGKRDYDAATGRWTAKDPIGFRGGQANLFAYVSNDPINRRDPWGLQDSPNSHPVRFGAPSAGQTRGSWGSGRYDASCWFSNAGGRGAAGGKGGINWPFPGQPDDGLRAGAYAEGDVGFEEDSYRGRVGVEVTGGVDQDVGITRYGRVWAETTSEGSTSIGFDYGVYADSGSSDTGWTRVEHGAGVRVDTSTGKVSPVVVISVSF